MKRRLASLPLLSVGSDRAFTYPTPINLSYWWGFGALSGIALVSQILTGVFLAMQYRASVADSFEKVEVICREVQGGWLLRYLRANGASFFFIVVYLHMVRTVYYASFKAKHTALWMSGVVIFLLMVITAFIGYVLPWGQMSLWGATVITNLLSSIPLVGSSVVEWVWGGYSVADPTIHRFYAIRYLLPFLLAALAIARLALLRVDGSSSPLGTTLPVAKISFIPYFTRKKVLEVVGLAVSISIVIYFAPNYLGHSDNYIEANPLQTPPRIVPEWYFLPFYAILRAVPRKLLGVILMLASILVWLLLPFLSKEPYGWSMRGYSAALITVFALLGWLGQQPVEAPYVDLGALGTVLYFLIVTGFSQWSY